MAPASMTPARGPGTVTDPIVLDLDSPPRSSSATKPPPVKRQRRAETQVIANDNDVFVYSGAPTNKATAPHVPAGPSFYYSQPIQSQSKKVAPAPAFVVPVLATVPKVTIPPPTLAQAKGKGKAPALAQSGPGPSVPPPVLGPAASPSKPTAKGRRAAQPKAPKPEKRLAMMKKAPPLATRERLDRVTLQRFFLVDRKRADINVEVQGEIKRECREEFQVLGSTGNVYTITIGRLPKCDCKLHKQSLVLKRSESSV